jgi:adenylosuccinate synthase
MPNNFDVDIIVGLQHGDEGKGCISDYLLQKKTWYEGFFDDFKKNREYDCVIKFNGGPNAGHTIYKDSKKFKLHHLTAGVVNNITVIIAPTCLIDLDKLATEINEVEKLLDEPIKHLIKISSTCHTITSESIDYDKANNKVGSTCCGIGPTFSKKCLRTNQRICDVVEGSYVYGCEIIDFNKFMMEDNKFNRVLFEGSQGYMLDLDLGDYPYVTSSNCTVGQALCNGIPAQYVKQVFGAAKIYDTYVGSKELSISDEDEETLERLGKHGKEVGVTTGRKRSCNWLNLDEVIEASNANGVTHLIFNKCDILNDICVYKLYYNNELQIFNCITDMQKYITKIIENTVPTMVNICYSYSQFGL